MTAASSAGGIAVAAYQPIGHATSVPTVPGAYGERPAPKPSAMACAGCENANPGEARGAQEARVVERRADTRALEDVPEVAHEPVGHIDRRVRDSAQTLAELDARLRLVQAARGLRYLWSTQGKRRAAELARHPEVVARARAAAIKRDPGRHFADRDDA